MAVFVSRDIVVSKKVNYVEWLESTGTQWIDLEVDATQDIGFEVDFLTKSAVATSGFGMILGCMNSGSNRYGVGTYPDKTGGGLFYGSAIYDPAITSGERMTISLLNGVLTTPAGTTNVSATTFSTGVSIALFGRKKSDGTVDELSKTRVFSCRVYENGTLIRDCWPCYDPDGVACMYDRVQKKYRYNQGSGEFTAAGGSGVEYTVSVSAKDGNASAVMSFAYVEINGTKYTEADVTVTSGTLVTVYAYNPAPPYAVIYVDNVETVVGGSTAGWVTYTYQVTGNISIQVWVATGNGCANIITS